MICPKHAQWWGIVYDCPELAHLNGKLHVTSAGLTKGGLLGQPISDAGITCPQLFDCEVMAKEVCGRLTREQNNRANHLLRTNPRVIKVNINEVK